MSRQAMGGVFTVTAYGVDSESIEGPVTLALAEANRLDHLLSNYREDSEWSRVNRLAASEPVTVSEELFNLLSACEEYSRHSEGTFDITVGPLVKAWGFFKDAGFVPTASELDAARANVGWRYILLDPQHRTVRFARPGVQLDPGGIGKGYAVDRMAEILRHDGVRSALISAASSSVYAIGAPPSLSAWDVSIPNPAKPHENVQVVHLRDQSISSSGSYEKFFVSNERVYSHIMDPRNGYPAQGRSSVSVIAPRTIDSEAWAKPYFIMGREWTERHRPSGVRVFMCEAADPMQKQSNCSWVM
ncbi:MAG TPA: FAD:protein FMN transferase [Bryobacteraceae bacterium]|nr:FAD:protein FMN transferase [Bryobacteraceae bacterium]